MPLQEGIILQRTKVRVPSPIVIFLGHSMAGVLGGLGAAAAMEALSRTTRISPAARAAIVAGGGLIAGGLVARNSPRLGTGVFVGAMAAAVPSTIEAVETWAAVREAPPSAVIEAAPPAPESPAITPSPTPSGAIGSGHAGPHPSQGLGLVMQRDHPNVLLVP